MKYIGLHYSCCDEVVLNLGCSSCGKALSGNENFCPACGRKLERRPRRFTKENAVAFFNAFAKRGNVGVIFPDECDTAKPTDA